MDLHIVYYNIKNYSVPLRNLSLPVLWTIISIKKVVVDKISIIDICTHTCIMHISPDSNVVILGHRWSLCVPARDCMGRNRLF